MTPEERARKIPRSFGWVPPYLVNAIAAAIREAIEAEREACARAAEDAPKLPLKNFETIAERIATAIRARGET